jgi:perosamine synthetase
MALKLFKPYISYRAIFNVVRVLLGTQLAEGPQVKLFEHEFSTKFGLKNVVALNSGTSALELAYRLAGIKDGDEVITPVLTCTATNLPLIHLGAKIVFADIDYDLNINIEDVKKKITNKTKAIVFVHFGGNNRGLEELGRICKDRHIILIEDAAQAVGSDYWGKSDFCCVSLQAIKTLTSGDGGFLICKRKEDYKKAKRLRWFGYDRDEKQKKGDTDLLEAGFKYHMNDITAAIGRGNLKNIDKILAKRKKLADYFNSIPGFTCHPWLCIYHGYLPVPKHIPSSQHHYRNDKYTVFKQFKNDCPIMDKLENSWTLVPYHHSISIRQAKKIVQAIY